MTLQEFKIDVLKRGFEIVEVLDMKKEVVNCTIARQDVDNAVFFHHRQIFIDTYLNEEEYINVVKHNVVNVESYIANRHLQNTNSCEHNYITVGNMRKCSLCMGDFGKVDVINVNLNRN